MDDDAIEIETSCARRDRASKVDRGRLALQSTLVLCRGKRQAILSDFLLFQQLSQSHLEPFAIYIEDMKLVMKEKKVFKAGKA